MSGCMLLARLPTGWLGDSLSAGIPITGERLPLHDRGKVLTQAVLMLAGGGEACADIEHLRAQGELFGSVPSDSTLYRTFRHIDAATLAGLWEAMAEVRAQVWRRSAATTGTATVVLDIDSSLHQIHSEYKEETAANYKGGFGFHPIYCFADATGETLRCGCDPATPAPTTSPITSPCWTRRSPSFPTRPPSAIDPVTIRLWCAGLSRCGSTRPAAPTSCGRPGPATSASRWWPAPTPAFMRPSAGSRPTTTPGSRRCAKTATNGPAPPSLSSPTWSTSPAGRRAPGSSCAANRCIPAPSRACFPPPCSATGGTTPTPPATPSPSTCTCGPTLTSRTTSAD